MCSVSNIYQAFEPGMFYRWSAGLAWQPTLACMETNQSLNDRPWAINDYQLYFVAYLGKRVKYIFHQLGIDPQLELPLNSASYLRF